MSLANFTNLWNNFSYHSFEYFFCPTLTLLPLWDSDDMNGIPIVVIHKFLELWLFLFFSLYSHCCLDWVICIVSFSIAWIFSSVPYIHSAFGPSIALFILVIIFFSSEISIWLFFISSIICWSFLCLCWGFVVFYLFQACF